jgi:4-nitrophenyl phosphatase
MLDFTSAGIRALILDMDGVLWRDSEQIGNLSAIFKRIHELNLQVVLATNNATRRPSQYVEKLAGFGVDIDVSLIATSAQATIRHLQERYPTGSPVFVIGMDSLKEQIWEAGYVQSAEAAKAVVVGIDRHITYEKIHIASALIRAGAEFIGTNPDKTFPTPQGLVPGAGTIIAAVAAAAETEPVIVGKPGTLLMDEALSRLDGIERSQALMVGDRLDTDIAAGLLFGCRTALVLSGVTSRDMVAGSTYQPDYVFTDLAELVGVENGG